MNGLSVVLCAALLTGGLPNTADNSDAAGVPWGDANCFAVGVCVRSCGWG